jgi:hypothetical protein
MNSHLTEFKAGDKVPISGVYEVIHDRLDGDLHAHAHEVTAIADNVFPPCRGCKGLVRFRLLQAIEHIDGHDHFHFQSERKE